METITETNTPLAKPLAEPSEDLSLIKEKTLHCGGGSRFLEKNIRKHLKTKRHQLFIYKEKELKEMKSNNLKAMKCIMKRTQQ
jgi:hypothetical protein